MSLKRVFFTVFTLLLVFTFCEETFAQRFQRGPLNRVGDYLGGGWGIGNHHRARPTNPSYYNPYTAHNSHLISRTNQGMDMGYHPNTTYANPGNYVDQGSYMNSYSDQVQMQALPGAVIHAETETHPADMNNKSTTDEENSDSGNEDPSLTFGGDFDSKATGLFERPVLATPDYRPTVDSKVKEKLKQLNEGNFWNDQ